MCVRGDIMKEKKDGVAPARKKNALFERNVCDMRKTFRMSVNLFVEEKPQNA